MPSTIRTFRLTSIVVLLAACAPIVPLSASDAANNALASAQQTAGAVKPVPAYAQAVAAEAEATQAPRDPGGLIKSMIQITDADRMGVKAGLVPDSVLIYDVQLLRMLVKTPATLEEHQRDPVWMKRKHALFAATPCSPPGIQRCKLILWL